MTEVVLAAITALVTAIGTFIGLVIAIVKVSFRLGTLETKVETMWSFQMRRAMSEVVTSGIGTVNSPLRFSESAYRSLAPIKDELIKFYGKLPKNISDGAALLEIERVFGDKLLKLVCIPCGLTHGACLLLALSVATQTLDCDPVL